MALIITEGSEGQTKELFPCSLAGLVCWQIQGSLSSPMHLPIMLASSRFKETSRWTFNPFCSECCPCTENLTGPFGLEGALMVERSRDLFETHRHLLCSSQVKCRSHEAFGHTARSRTSPMKQGHALLVPQPLGARKKKENKDPCRPQGLQKLNQVPRQK